MSRRRGAWRNQPATTEQQSFLRGLAKDLGVDPHLAPGMSRGEASDLIENLRARRDEPRGQAPKPMTSRQQIKEYNAEQARQFDGATERQAPHSTGIVVWKRFPNVMQSPTQIIGGWAWACHDDSHRAVVKGKSRGSYERACAYAAEHHRRMHWQR